MNDTENQIKESADELASLIEGISKWHFDRNLIDGSTDKDQYLKLSQEMGELSDSICKKRKIDDDIGDIIVVLINIATRNGVSITACLRHAYNDIKDRRGKMVDGVFIKETDNG
jgi:uncharacterized protein YabN with tetrapyrrole methylase and pyrophosphatase domain